ncbi:hypothetical protein HPY28_15775 [Brevibacillus sp. HB1.2]|uniref:methionyl-tRNA formyltransferase n=1 Tax=Brevibacillus sp. HB1.2 TaxID=2738807 RepID=UPI001575B9AE|nr:hypothetical protein [Brevibacillus sp. HB1.2]
MRTLKIVLMGRKSWAAKALKYIVEQGHEVLAVVCPSSENELDHKLGTLEDSAQYYQIPCYRPDQFYFEVEKNKSYYQQTDLIISYLFWEKIKEPLLSLAKIGCINFHPGPLPDLRGFGVYAFAILKGLKEYGVSAHYVNEEIDTGDIISIKKFPIEIEETAFSLEKKSQKVMFELFKETIGMFCSEKSITRHKQEINSGEYFSRKVFESLKRIQSSDDLETINKKIRAFWYPPYQGAYIEIEGKKMTLVNEEVIREVAEILHNNKIDHN